MGWNVGEYINKKDQPNFLFWMDRVNKIKYTDKELNYALRLYGKLHKKHGSSQDVYSFNLMLNMLYKERNVKLFWLFFIKYGIVGIGGKIKFNSFTYATVMEVCLFEKNYIKMRMFYDMYEREQDRRSKIENKQSKNEMTLCIKMLRIQMEVKEKEAKEEEKNVTVNSGWVK